MEVDQDGTRLEEDHLLWARHGRHPRRNRVRMNCNDILMPLLQRVSPKMEFVRVDCRGGTYSQV